MGRYVQPTAGLQAAHGAPGAQLWGFHRHLPQVRAHLHGHVSESTGRRTPTAATQQEAQARHTITLLYTIHHLSVGVVVQYFTVSVTCSFGDKGKHQHNHSAQSKCVSSLWLCRRLPCHISDLFKFCWTLFVYTKGTEKLNQNAEQLETTVV